MALGGRGTVFLFTPLARVGLADLGVASLMARGVPPPTRFPLMGVLGVWGTMVALKEGGNDGCAGRMGSEVPTWTERLAERPRRGVVGGLTRDWGTALTLTVEESAPLGVEGTVFSMRGGVLGESTFLLGAWRGRLGVVVPERSFILLARETLGRTMGVPELGVA